MYNLCMRIEFTIIAQ